LRPVTVITIIITIRIILRKQGSALLLARRAPAAKVKAEVYLCRDG
jgi:hypothetical protein